VGARLGSPPLDTLFGARVYGRMGRGVGLEGHTIRHSPTQRFKTDAVATGPQIYMPRCSRRSKEMVSAQDVADGFAQKSIETVSQTERCNITGGEPAAALALRT
jgi:hypothetical protein